MVGEDSFDVDDRPSDPIEADAGQPDLGLGLATGVGQR